MIKRVWIAGAFGAALLAGAALEWRASRPVDPWTLVDMLGKAGFFKAIPAGAVILAPNLWDGRGGVPASGADAYLSAYFSRLAGHSLRAVHGSNEAYELLSRGVPVYYCERQWLPGRRAAVLIFSRLQEPGMEAAPFGSDHLTLVASSEWRHMAVEYGAPEIHEAPVIEWRDEGGAFVSDVAVPGWTPGSTHLLDEETGQAVQVAVALDFVHGFASVTERNGGHYFRWNDSPDGAAEIDLVNSLSRPLTVRFQTALRFNPALETGGFEITTPWGQESIRSKNGGLLERVWTLQPGSNRIVFKCLEGRIPTPGDQRYIFFGLWDWKVVPEGSAEASQ